MTALCNTYCTTLDHPPTLFLVIPLGHCIALIPSIDAVHAQVNTTCICRGCESVGL